jgi:hypothetical protein
MSVRKVEVVSLKHAKIKMLSEVESPGYYNSLFMSYINNKTIKICRV